MCPNVSPGFNNPHASVDAYGKIRKKEDIKPLPKKAGRPKGREYTETKTIRLTEEQASKWDVDKIRDFLDSNGKKKTISTSRESKNEIIPQLIEIFTKHKDKVPIETFRDDLLKYKIIKAR